MGISGTDSAIQNAGATHRVAIWTHVVPETVAQVQDAVRRSTGRLSVSGARYSPDEQFAEPGALHLDLTRLNRVVRFEPIERIVTVQAGISWFDLLRFLQPHGLCCRLMPEFANFSVGGAIASNLQGPYLGRAAVGEAVRGLTVVLADGSLRRVDVRADAALMRALVGGFGGIAIIVEAELELAENRPLLRRSARMEADLYPDFLKARVQTDPQAVMHCAEFEGPALDKLRSVTWVETAEAPTHQQVLHFKGIEDPLRRVLDWSQPTTAWGRLYRRVVVEPLRSARKTVHWRSFEASHDLEHFDPKIHDGPLYDVQVYGVPLAAYQGFLQALKAIVVRHRVPVVRLSLTSSAACGCSVVGLAVDDTVVFRLVVRAASRESADAGVWTRELVQAAIDGGGRFDPAHRMLATREQFERAFPDHPALVAAKRQLDPLGRLSNGFWRRYLGHAPIAAPGAQRLSAGGDPTVTAASPAVQAAESGSEFVAALAHPVSHDNLYRLIREIGPRGQGKRVFQLLERQASRCGDDELIYRNLRRSLLKWRHAWHAPLTLRRVDWLRNLQRRLLPFTMQHLRLLPSFDGRELDGVAEMATQGRHLAALRRQVRLKGAVLQFDEFGLPVRLSGPAELSRESARAVLPARALPGGEWSDAAFAGTPASLDLVTLYAGLSSLGRARIDGLLAQVAAALRPGGLVLFLDHDAESAHAGLEASLAVRLAALFEHQTWEQSEQPLRGFRAADEWVELFGRHGLIEVGGREKIQRSPLGNMLMAFQKPMA